MVRAKDDLRPQVHLPALMSGVYSCELSVVMCPVLFPGLSRQRQGDVTFETGLNYTEDLCFKQTNKYYKNF